MRKLGGSSEKAEKTHYWTHLGAIRVIVYCKQRNKNTIYRTFISDSCETSIIPRQTYVQIEKNWSETPQNKYKKTQRQTTAPRNTCKSN